MRMLIGAACVAIIAAAAYYFWSEYRAAQSAKAEEDERTMRSVCQLAYDQLPETRALYDDCVKKGYR